MEQGTKAAAEAEARPKPFSLPNGVLRKQHHHTHRPPPPAAAAAAAAAPAAAEFMYRECLKNHAASLGGHALDGCGEFMLSPTADPADPSSLRCAACGCHRNFHRRLPGPHRRDGAEDDRDGTEEEEEEEEEEEDDDDDGEEEGEGKIPPPHHRGSRSPPPPPFHSAPHMLLALSAGLHGGLSSVPVPARPVAVPSAAVAAATSTQPRKRFRSKFSPQQKGRMQELSQRLGWRMQKRDEGLVEELCREIGVDKGVFKVWMHNNKHTFLGLARRGSNTGAGGGAQTERLSVGTNGDGSHHIGRDDARDDADGGNGHVANGSFSS